MSTLFQTVNSDTLSSFINGAKARLAMAAPGISDHVAKQIVVVGQRIGWSNVRIVVDCGPEPVRLGYGTVTAIDAITTAGGAVFHHPGLRIGVALVDQNAIIFAPTVQYAEAEPAGSRFAPNAVLATADQVELMLDAIMPEVPANPEHKTEAKIADKAEIGIMPAVGEILDQTKVSLEQSPPVAPDRARMMRVLNSKFMLVRLSLKGVKFKSRKISVNAAQLGISDEILRKRIEGQWLVFDGEDIDIKVRKAMRPLMDKWEAILNLTTLLSGTFGRAVLNENIQALQAQLTDFKNNSIPSGRDSVKSIITEALQESRLRLHAMLIKNFTDNPPVTHAAVLMRDQEQRAKQIEKLTDDMLKHLKFPSVEALLEDIEIEDNLFHVSESLLNKAEFQEAVQKAFGIGVDQIAQIDDAIGIKDLTGGSSARV